MTADDASSPAAVLVRRLVDCLYTFSSREWQKQVWFAEHPMGYVDSFGDAAAELEYLVEYLLEPELLDASGLTAADLIELQALDEQVGRTIDERGGAPFTYETTLLDLEWKDVMQQAGAALRVVEHRTGLRPSISENDRPSSSSG